MLLVSHKILSTHVRILMDVFPIDGRINKKKH